MSCLFGEMLNSKGKNCALVRYIKGKQKPNGRKIASIGFVVSISRVV